MCGFSESNKTVWSAKLGFGLALIRLFQTIRRDQNLGLVMTCVALIVAVAVVWVP